MKYKVHNIKVSTTSTGKTKADVELIGENEIVTPNATIWGDFKGFETITFGAIVEGDLVPAKDPKYGPTLYPPKADIRRAPSSINKAMEVKKENIQLAQENKERGIMTSSTIRMAVDIALAEAHGLPFDVGVVKGRVKEWRKWLISEWDNLDAPPFN